MVFQSLEFRLGRRMVKPRPRLGSFRRRRARRGGKQRINSLMSKPGNFVMHEIAADHAFGEPCLVLLIDHPATADKIMLAPCQEFTECDLLYAAAALRVMDTNNTFQPRSCGDIAVKIRKSAHRQLDFPDAHSTVTTILLQHTRFPGCQARR